MSLVVDTGPLNGFGDIAPWIGLQYLPAVQLQAALMELPLDRFNATVGDNVGIILGDGYRSWSGLASFDDVVGAVVRAASRMLAFADLEALPSTFEIPGATTPTAFNAVPIYLLLGVPTEVERWLAKGALDECQHPGPVCDQFRRFEANARSRLRPNA
jgi:hypothetical protein